MMTFTILGLVPLKEKLKAVSEETQYRGGRQALRKAAQVIRDAARKNAERLDDPETGRKIALNIAERWNGRLFKQTGALGFRVGVLHGAVLPKDGNPDTGVNGPTPHWRLLELGTEKMAARPFLRPALDNNVNLVIDTFATNYEKALDRAIRRANRAAARAE